MIASIIIVGFIFMALAAVLLGSLFYMVWWTLEDSSK